METLAQIAPLLILFPAIGAFINFFWGGRLTENASGGLGTAASGLSFLVALGLLLYLTSNDFTPVVVNPPLLDSWIRVGEFEISWQSRVDTLSVSMAVFVTFVSTLIHLYAMGYMRGDSRYQLFFAYLNMFLAFMLILVMGNNYLMMFVGWEGVGLSSYVLISFWWDLPRGKGLANSNAGRKAFIANRVGDFGVLIAVLLLFWAFGTLDYYKPREVPNPGAGVEHATHEGDAAGEEGESHGEGEGAAGEEMSALPGIQLVTTGVPASAQEDGEGDGQGAETAGSEEAASADGDSAPFDTYAYSDEDIETRQLGIFGQVARLVEQDAAADAVLEAAQTAVQEAQAAEDDAALSEAQAAMETAQADAEAMRPRFSIGSLELNMETLLVIVTLLLLLGVTGKSAQIPLFVWLPDAMAGPTPVSALIHAATMVTAGVYMMVRSNVLFFHADFTSFIVALIGALTALIAGFIAVGQFDIKRVLAYSTISQLGFMVAAVGMGAYVAAMFHLITHAFFKALLFLGSGSVIHGVEHGHHHAEGHGGAHDEDFDPQDMRNMGGLSKKMPVTYWTYVFGTLALAGIWPFAGFWSKDEILADAWHGSFVEEWAVGVNAGEVSSFIVLVLLVVAAAFTAFYMWRQIEMVFHGQPRTEAADNAVESGPTMTIPLVVLAIFSLLAGFINIPSGIGSAFTLGLDNSFGLHALGDFLEYSIFEEAFFLPPFTPLLAIFTLVLGLAAIFTARAVYGGTRAVDEQGRDPLAVNVNTGAVWQVAHAKLYWDEVYFALIIHPYRRAANLLAQPFDLGIIDGIVNGVAASTARFSGWLRHSQTGYVRTYAVAFLLGVVTVIVLMLLPLLQLG